MIHRLILPLLLLLSVTVPGGATGPAEVMLEVQILRDDGVADRTLDLTEADLRAMGQDVIMTSTPWTEGVQTFEGVALSTLLAKLNVTSGTMYMYAVNDYRIEVPLSDAKSDGPIIAYATNGEPMPLRDKGPLWLVYPYDSNADFRSETIYSRSIWQLNRIEITP